MKKMLVLCATLFFALSACGGEDAPTMYVTEEAAGAKCPHGGVKIVVDYTTYYACNGAQGPAGQSGPVGQSGDPGTKGDQGETGTAPTITTEQIEKDATDNPCEGPALKVTVTPVDSTNPPLTEYVCQAYDPVPDIFYTRTQDIFDLNQANTQAYCLCNHQLNYTSVEECLKQRQKPYSERQHVSHCNNTAYYEYEKPAPQKMFEAYECFFEVAKEINNCSLAVPQDTCSAADAATLTACQELAGEQFSPCVLALTPEENTSINEWADDYDNYLDTKNCTFSYQYIFN